MRPLLMHPPPALPQLISRWGDEARADAPAGASAAAAASQQPQWEGWQGIMRRVARYIPRRAAWQLRLDLPPAAPPMHPHLHVRAAPTVEASLDYKAHVYWQRPMDERGLSGAPTLSRLRSLLNSEPLSLGTAEPLAAAAQRVRAASGGRPHLQPHDCKGMTLPDLRQAHLEQWLQQLAQLPASQLAQEMRWELDHTLSQWVATDFHGLAALMPLPRCAQLPCSLAAAADSWGRGLQCAQRQLAAPAAPAPCPSPKPCTAPLPPTAPQLPQPPQVGGALHAAARRAGPV